MQLLKITFAVLMCVTIAACSTPAPKKERPPLKLSQTSFSNLNGWQSGNHAPALGALMNSCKAWKFKDAQSHVGCGDLALKAQHWQNICGKAAQVAQDFASPQYTNSRLITNFFETHFTPYRVSVDGRDDGLFTGYYIPEIKGSLTRDAINNIPVYRVPPELAKGKEYYTRAEIYSGKLANRGLEIAWVADPVALFFVEIQGSGVIRLPNNEIFSIGFAGKNNHSYVALGRVMEEQGMLEPGNVNLFTIKEWLYNNPNRAQSVMEQNPSYIFFRPLPDNQIRGAQNVPLTAQRSLAVDWHYIPYGFPVYLNTSLPQTPFGPAADFNQLMIAQDTGGAIRGGIRGDIYFGHGAQAEALAGKQAMRGGYSLLLPKALTASINTNEVHACTAK